MKKRWLSILLVLCLVLGMVPAVGTPAAAAGALELPKGAGSGTGFIYYDFVETTQFVPGTTYAFLDGTYGQSDAVAQLGSGAMLEATDKENKSWQYMVAYYYMFQGVPPEEIEAAVYVNVVKPGKGFDSCRGGGLYQVPGTSNPAEYRYFCWAGGAQNCGPLYAYTYQTAEITWDNVTVYINDPGRTASNNSADYTVKLTYGDGQTVKLDPRSYTVQCSGQAATVTITDNDGNTIQGQVTLPGAVIYQPGALNVSGMPANQGIQPGGSIQVASDCPTRTGGYEFQCWEDADGEQYQPGDTIGYKADGYTLTAVWKDTQAPTFTCGTVEVMTGTTGEVVKNSIKAALKITDNESVTGCTVTVNADNTTAQSRGEKQVSVTVQDAAGNQTTQNVTLKVLPGPLTFDAPVYDSGTLSAILWEPGPDTITETGIVWGVISSPTTTVNNGKFTTSSPVTTPGDSISTTVQLAQGVPYYARAYAKVGDVIYYGPQAIVGDSIPSYGKITIQNNNNNTFTVSRSGGTDGEQTVYYRTVNGSAVGGTHFEHKNGTVTIPDGQSSADITITEYDVNAQYDGNAATGYSNASRTYSVEIYRVDGGAVIEGSRAAATRTMTRNTTVDRNEFTEKTDSRPTETKRGDYDVDGKLGWTNGTPGSGQEHIDVQPDQSIQAYVQAVSDEIRYYVTFDAREEESGYQAVQIVPGGDTDTSIYPYDDNLSGSYSTSIPAGYTALFEHGKSKNDANWYSYHFPAGAFPSQSNLKQEEWTGTDTGDYIAFSVNTEQITTSYGACGSGSDAWYTQNVVHHYQFIDDHEPTLLAVADMGGSTYRVGDSFTVSLIFDEIVDSQNSTLSGKTISTSWGTATYAGGGDTNVLYFTGTVPANASGTLSVTGTNATIKDMADNGNTPAVSGEVPADVDTRTPSFDLSAGSISGGVGRATISNANNDTTSLRYAWSQSSAMPATGWIPLTSDELAAAQTTGFTAMTRQESGTWYLHVLGICDSNGALVYKSTSVDFSSSGDPDPVQPPSISVSVNNDDWATSRTITVNAQNGTVEYRYGDGVWQAVSGGSVTVNQNGTYAFRCVSKSGEAVTATAEVSKIDTIDPTASIGDMTANTPTQKAGVYHSITLPIDYGDTQSGVKTAEYVWSSSATAPDNGWASIGDNNTSLTYHASEASEADIYLHLRVTDNVGHTVTVSSPAYQVISEEGAKNYAPTITIGLLDNTGTDFTPWDGTTWTNETQTLEWKLVGEHTDNCVVTLPDGRTTTDASGTILVSQNGSYEVSVVDNIYGGSNSASYTIDKIDTTAPTVSHDWASTGWQSKAVTVKFDIEDQGGSGLDTAKYKIVDNNTETPTDLTPFSSNTGGNVTVSEDGTWYIYYEVTDNTAGTYGDGTDRPANITSGFVGPIQINTGKPTLQITGGETGASSLTLEITSSGSERVTVVKDGGQAVDVGESYTVTEAGTYTFTAISNAGVTTQKDIQVHSITFDSDGGSEVSSQLVVSGGKATEPSAPTYPGFIFDGWYDGSSRWDFPTGEVKKDLTLTAHWKQSAYSVTLTASHTDVTYGETVTLTADVTQNAAGDMDPTYTWYKDGAVLSGQSGRTLTLSNISDSGSYQVELTVSEDGQTQTIPSNTVTIKIVPRPVTLNWNYTAPIPYDGQEHTVAATISNLVQGDSCELTYDGITQGTAVGNYETTVTGLSNPNYTLEGGANTKLAWEIITATGNASVTIESWTYGEPPKQPVPSSSTNGIDHVTYHYTGTTSGGVSYDSDTVPTDAGKYTVTATFAATANHEAVTATADFTIAERSIFATWSGLYWVYGQMAEAQVTLSGVVEGDDVSVNITGVKQTAGSHPLTAALNGTDTANYTLKNENATLTIQPKPVIFIVKDNAVQADGSEKKATVTADDATFTKYTVTYRQNGTEISSPKEVGSYEIWVKITDSNYRHTNGSDTMQVGTLTITQAPPVLYTVSFAGGEGASGSMTELQAASGSVLTLPECGYEKANYKFMGWLYDGKTYQPGDRFTMPGADVTFTAQWQEVFEVSGTITEKTDGTDANVENAVVSLWLGANKIGETTTEADGTYGFTDLMPGIYNLVVTKDVRTVTSKVEITTADKICDATLPKGATNSIVKVTPGSPDIVVGKLDTMFENTDETVYTEDDQKNVKEGGKVEITFNAEEKQRGDTSISSDMEKIAAKKDDSVTVGLVMDYKLEKEVFDKEGNKTDSENITQANVLLEVLLPLPAQLQGKNSYSVYRVHNGTAQELTMTPSSDLGEYFTVSSDKTKLTLYVKCFSTYAIGYSDSSSGNQGGSSGGGSSMTVYPPKVEQPEHGSVSVKPSSPQKGDKVTITPTPEEGYTVDEVIVTDPNGKPVEVAPNGDGTYTFVQPTGKVTITVTFRQTASTSACPRDESCPMAPFTDADRLAWYHDGVHYCVENGLMVGTSESTFEPNTAITRGMIVTILWRLEGSPMVDGALDYDDVTLEDWYGKAISWADSADVAAGYGNGRFGPNDAITREQLAAMLWRYAGSPAAEGSLFAFTDGTQTSDWAQPAMVWAVDQGLIAGVGDQRLDPLGQATRAQAAAILMRFAENNISPSV